MNSVLKDDSTHVTRRGIPSPKHLATANPWRESVVLRRKNDSLLLCLYNRMLYGPSVAMCRASLLIFVPNLNKCRPRNGRSAMSTRY